MTRVRKWLGSPWAYLVAALIIGALLSLTQGLTNWWDIRNYHIYNAWALLHDRYTLDLFPAGIQSYFSPLADVPYFLVAWDWFPNHPRLVAALTGLPYGLLIFVAWRLADRVLSGWAAQQPILRKITLLATVVFSVSGTSTWSQAFGVSNDVLVSAIVLGALGLLLDAFDAKPERALGIRRAFAIGLLLGIAAGWKLTALEYAPATGLLLLATCRDWKSALRKGAVFFAGWLIAFGALYGPWALHLYKLTGDPLFPQFNNLFHSPFASAASGRDVRFLPKSTVQWLFYPFYWLSDKQPTVFPLNFRDARFALAYCLGGLTLVAALVKWRRRDDLRHLRLLLALLGFLVVAYVTWLRLFSMLRYGIALEVGACLLTISCILYLLRRFAPRLPQVAAFAVVVVIITASMRFARIPDLGHVHMQAPVFAAKVPKLRNDPLVILANQPMGLLAPLIQRSNPHATFIGIPSCFRTGDWCYQDFYRDGLGTELRHKVATHAGPIYVVRYVDRIPVMPQLRAFNVVLDDDAACKPLSTNRTANAVVCPARYVASMPSTPAAVHPFKLSVNMLPTAPGFSMSTHWQHNACSTTTPQDVQLAFNWVAPAHIRRVIAYVIPPPSSRGKPFGGGEATGSTETGPWVTAGQDFVLKDASGRTLARGTVDYARCTRAP